MSNLRIVAKNAFDDGSVMQIVGTGVTSLPPTNLQIYNNSKVFRSLSPEHTVLAGNFNDVELISACILWRHNLTNAAKIKLELFGLPNQQGTLIYDSGEIDAVAQITFADWDWRTQPVISGVLDEWDIRFSQLWLEPQFSRSYRLTITDPLNSNGHIDITRIYMGRHITPKVNFKYGNSWGLGSNEMQFRTDDGSLFSQNAPRWRQLNFTVANIPEGDRAGLLGAIRNVGKTKDFFISLYPEVGGQKEAESSFAGKFTTIPSLTANFYDNYTMPFSIEEC
ncbi:hypothetical protein [Alishewanella jeotgali]|uniref:Uncharacterized protein n=1 Tax=Alishewanella jeotgali KCTC 22429 TaxID=1129374 RepID=H3Z9P0_9ALTE|nr:hypothetical protein [Alishewanella jeotgali]EHR42741.1 hypothetical protein AJE_00205 [Alishewanella jeotgali KCTC 22429]